MQEQRYLGRLEPGMDVCDVNGDKIGSVERVYRHELVTATAGEATGGTTPLPREDIVEVKTGLLGLGKHYYVPFNEIQDVTSGSIFLKEAKERIDTRGWDTKPDYLDEMS